MSWWDDWGSDLFEAGVSIYDYDQGQDAIDDSQDIIQEGFQQQNPWAQYQPAMGAGLMQILSDPSMITQTPGYQFAYDQGLQALGAKHASSGNRYSGRALTEAMQYGQGLASQMYNQEVNRYASYAGATTPNVGGIETAQNQSALNQQESFNTGYFLNNLLNNFSGNQTSVTDQGPGYGQDNWASP